MCEPLGHKWSKGSAELLAFFIGSDEHLAKKDKITVVFNRATNILKKKLKSTHNKTFVNTI